jgi:transcriptional regulator with PAS, ATPase and Fis domain
MDILLTFTGFHDPYTKGMTGNEDQPGPILSLLSTRSFQHVFLFDTPTTTEITQRTYEAIESLHSALEIHIIPLVLTDPTNYQEIFSGLREHAITIQNEFSESRFFISVASGTPQMHACWVLLAASGELPAKIVHIRPERFVTKSSPAISEIDLSAEEFPVVRFTRAHTKVPNVDVESVRSEIGIIGDHPLFLKSLETGAMLAPSHTPILISGETGTGKDLFAQYIHALSERPMAPFIVVNCAAIPDELVESILFGHKKGAFTGAITDQTGKFDAANNGTLFLDELGELPLSAQSKLLRVLQDGVVEPIGYTTGHKVSVRIIAATNKDLRKQIRKGHFREDLYYRLNVGEIKLPSLRERRSDIPKLALHILDRLNRFLKNPRRLTAKALNRLQAHNWEGNVRDLENVIERSIRLSRADVLDAADLLISEPIAYDDPFDALPEPHEGFSLDEFLGSSRRQLILRALETSKGNQSQAAKILGMTPQAVNKFLMQSSRKL